MSRSYAATDLIQLPRLSARETVVLATQIETAVTQIKADLAPEDLPLPIKRACARVLDARDALDAVLAPQPKEGDSQAKRKADRAVDSGWTAFFSWLQGWCQLPPQKNPSLAQALSLRDLVFGEGLRFTQLPYKIQWQESKSRLEAIARDGHETTIGLLGGKPFLENLKETQAVYGEVLGITAVVSEVNEVDLRAKQLATLDAIRVFVTRASAHADPEEKGSEQLADKLLAPILQWESRPAAPEEDSTPPADPTPA